jgi:hypothetical protein
MVRLLSFHAGLAEVYLLLKVKKGSKATGATSPGSCKFYVRSVELKILSCV